MSPCGVAVETTVSVGVFDGARVSEAGGPGVLVGRGVKVANGVAGIGFWVAGLDGLAQPVTNKIIKMQPVCRKIAG